MRFCQKLIQPDQPSQRIGYARILRSAAIAMSCGLLALSGCTNQQASNAQPQPTADQPLIPKLHKPGSLNDAIERLSEITGDVTGQGELEDRIVSVVEIVHGEGPGAHSHFYLESDFAAGDRPDDHDDHGEHESEKRHEMKVDPFDEFIDIANWLPDIAADGDLERSDWQAVKQLASNLQSFGGKVVEKQSRSDRRERFRNLAPQIEQTLKELKQISQAADVPANEGNSING